MNIAYLSSSFFPSKAANSVHVVRMSEALVKAGHTVTLFAFAEGVFDLKTDYGLAHSFETVTIPRKKTGRIAKVLSFLRAASVMDTSTFDLIYVRNVTTALFVKKSKPIILETHALLGFLWKLRVNFLLRQKNVVAVVAITQALADDFVKVFPLAEGKILVASDCATTPTNVEPTPTGKLTVGYIGHLYEGRGIDIVVGLAESFPDLDFLVVGGEDEHVTTWKQRCTHIPNLSFEGYVPHGKLGEYYTRIDIVLAPYQQVVRVSGNVGDTGRWMSPLKIFEYMSYGKPMLISDLPVLREVLKDGETCLLCEPSDPASWKTQLSRLTEDETFRHRLGKQAYADFLEHYTWDARVKKILNYVEERL